MKMVRLTYKKKYKALQNFYLSVIGKLKRFSLKKFR